MPDAPKQREWQDIARDASKESNPDRLKKLTDELSDVMDSRREYFQHRGETQNLLPPSREGVVQRLRRILDRARKGNAA